MHKLHRIDTYNDLLNVLQKHLNTPNPTLPLYLDTYATPGTVDFALVHSFGNMYHVYKAYRDPNYPGLCIHLAWKPLTELL